MASTRIGNGGPIGYLAEILGASEPALKLLLTIFFGYPLALVHRHFLFGKSRVVQHLFFVVCGLTLGYYNYGFDIIHSIVSVFIIYVILATMGGTFQSVVISFLFLMKFNSKCRTN